MDQPIHRGRARMDGRDGKRDASVRVQLSSVASRRPNTAQKTKKGATDGISAESEIDVDDRSAGSESCPNLLDQAET